MEQNDFEMTELQSSIEFKVFVITDLQSRNFSTECSRSCLASSMAVIVRAAIVVVNTNLFNEFVECGSQLSDSQLSG